MQKDDKCLPDLKGFGGRLRHERARLGWTQQEMAEKGGVTRITQGRYERGEAYPDLVYLAALAGSGVDFVYVCCGVVLSATMAVVDFSAR